jgi:hypothetical protein
MDLAAGSKDLDAGQSPATLVKCEACGETWAMNDLEKWTWQQWECPCCGRWNDRGGDHAQDER